ncbi:MAG: hypothetical protein SP1CHLAM54_17220 [Chlamydiia bacterium]|nr:hypothetical protein [Chlamydiia bacterium]MCH9616610.1 hypothetical protein [Chlamydiia bacterium]MCH9629340.1 hypothetical protein [Chlamydiia bacterium]
MAIPVNPASGGQGPKFSTNSDVNQLTNQMDTILKSQSYHELYYENGSHDGALDLKTHLEGMQSTLENGTFPQGYDTSHALDLVSTALNNLKQLSTLLDQDPDTSSAEFQDVRKEAADSIDDLGKYT